MTVESAVCHALSHRRRISASYGVSVGNSDLVWWSYPVAEVFSLVLTHAFFHRLYKTIIAPLPEGRE